MARLILTEPGEDIDVGGNVTVIGTSAPGEVITVIRGNIVLDPSFNIGGDIIRLPDLASAFTVRIVGSTVILSSETATVTIPVGPPGLEVAFDDVSRTLLFDTALNAAKLGDQIVTTSETGVLPAGATQNIVGTEGADTINGTANADVIDGLGGNDTIDGQDGDDFIRGGLGDDTIAGGLGDDEIRGGGGNDRITDNDGDFAVLDGGVGNDTIRVNNLVITSFSINGGDGDDIIELTLGTVGFGIVSAGNGADRVVVSSQGSMEVSLQLGAGQDELVIPAGALGTGNFGTTIVQDFAVGPNGDRIDLGAALAGYLQNYTPGSNPFASGHLRLSDTFGNAKLEVDRDGAAGPGGADELIRFAGVDKDTLTAENFSGFDPKASVAAAPAASLAVVSEPELIAQDVSQFGDFAYVAADPLDLFGGNGGYFFLA